MARKATKLTALVSDRKQEKDVGRTDRVFAGLDLSFAPSKNDRMAKLGVFNQTMIGSVLEYDPKTKGAKLADGVDNPQRSIRPLEPDNLVYRNHGGRDAVWAIRGICEHSNKWGDKHRSTLFIDQCKDQNWGFFSDMGWVKDLDSKAGLGLNGAGIYTGLMRGGRSSIGGGGISGAAQTALAKAAAGPGGSGFKFTPGVISGGGSGGGGGGGKSKLCALMFNINKRAGYVTDGIDAGQFWHVFSLWPSGGSKSEEECEIVSRKDLTLRGDVAFDMGGKNAHIAMGGAYETKGDIFSGMHWLYTPSPLPPAGELSEDGKSVHPVLARRLGPGIWVYIKKPQEWVPTEDGGWGVPPGWPGVPGGTLTPTQGSQGNLSGYIYPAGVGVVSGEAFIYNIPEQIATPQGVDIAINFVTPAAPNWPGITINLQLEYFVVAPGGACGGALTGTFALPITAGLFPAASTDYRYVCRIPSSQLIGAEGGKIAFALYRTAGLNAAGLLVVSKMSHFGDAVAA